jgi:glycosyltransferase involved in cell wall biosynthesis
VIITGCAMHIGIDARLTAYRTGGIATYTRALIAALDRLNTQHRLTVFDSRRSDLPLQGRFQTRALWTPPHHRLERAALSLELARFRLDVLHSPDFIPPRRGARRHVITIHDLNFLREPDFMTAASRRYYNDQINQAVRQADRILAVSEATRHDLITLLAVPPEKIVVQPHGVDPRFRPMSEADSQQARSRLKLPQDYILHVGTLEPRKNIPALLDAYFALPPDLRRRFSLVLVGRPGWLFEETQARIDRLQSSGEAIIIRSDIDDVDLPAVYNLARVLALPTFYEGFGLPALEAMACGTAVIVSGLSSLPEVVGDVGAQIDPHDPATLTAALIRALTDDGWSTERRRAGIERSRLFTWERSAQIALATYEALG